MPRWQDHQALKHAVEKFDSQDDFAEFARGLTAFNFTQSEISKLLTNQKRMNSAERMVALKSVINGLVDGTINISAVQSAQLARAAEKDGRPNKVSKFEFHEIYPSSYFTHFARAKNLWISGLNLRRILHGRLSDIKNALKRGGTVQLIFIDPDVEELCRYAAMQDWGQSDAKAPSRYSESIRTTYRALSGLQTQSANRRNVGKLMIRKLRYPLGFGIDAMTFYDGAEEDEALYVRYYPMFSDEEDRPIVRLRPSDEYWYAFYKRQFQLHWRLGEPWNQPERKKGKGVDRTEG